MLHPHRLIVRSVLVATVALAVFATPSSATAPPVGALPAGSSSAIQTTKGELVAFALPHRSGGRVWRIARTFDVGVLRQVSEADVGGQVVLVFRATGHGTTTVAFGLTRGERTKAYESRLFTVKVGA
jgi:hypothetical protein